MRSLAALLLALSFLAPVAADPYIEPLIVDTWPGTITMTANAAMRIIALRAVAVDGPDPTCTFHATRITCTAPGPMQIIVWYRSVAVRTPCGLLLPSLRVPGQPDVDGVRLETPPNCLYVPVIRS